MCLVRRHYPRNKKPGACRLGGDADAVFRRSGVQGRTEGRDRGVNWAAAGSAAVARARGASLHAKEPILVDFFMGSPFCCRLLRNVCAAIRTAPGASFRR
jgi:hypothetical protein